MPERFYRSLNPAILHPPPPLIEQPGTGQGAILKPVPANRISPHAGLYGEVTPPQAPLRHLAP